MWLVLLRRYWLPIAALALITFAGIWHMSQVRKSYHAGYTAAQSEAAQELAKARAENERIRIQAGQVYAKQDRALTDRVLRIDSVPIRLCTPKPEVRLPDAPISADGASSGGGQDLSVGPDIERPSLVLATECERDRRKVIWWQKWASEQAGR